MGKFTPILVGTALTAVMLGSNGAYAQSAPEPTAADADAVNLGDIVVTAQRRNERQSQVPISITAYSTESLAKTGVTDARSLTQITPGLNFQSVGSSAQPLIRGIGSTGSSVGDSSNVAIYIDGVYQPFQAANYLRFVDIERIEVLKGPQGTLFGRNAAGGAISVTTLGPSLDEATGRLSVSYGRFNEVEANGFVSTPVSDTVAVSLSGNYTHTDGFRKDVYLDKRLGYLHAYNVRGKVLAEPTDRTRVLISGYYNWSNDLSSFGNQELDGLPALRATIPDILSPSKPNTSALNLVPRNRVKSWGGHLKIEHDLDFATLTSLTAFSNSRQFVLTDSDLTPAASSQSRIFFGDDMVSQDVTLTSNGDGPFSWLVGGTYYREDGFFNLYSYGGLTTPGDPPLTSGVNVHDIKISAIAFFAEGTYKLTDRLTVIAGARYSNDKPEFSGMRLFPGSGAENPATLTRSKDSFSSFTPRVSLRYAVTPAVNAYASYSRGFKSGVFNGNNLQVKAVKPETVDAFEIGMKGSPSRAISFDAAAYYYDYKNVQVSSFGAFAVSPTLRNAAAAEIYGFEANATVMPLEGLTLRAGGAYTHAEYSDFEGAPGYMRRTNGAGQPIGGNVLFPFDGSGARMIRTPRLQLNGTVSYETDLASGGKLDFNLTGSRTSRINHDVSANFVQPAFTVVNGNIGYTTPDGHWRGSIYGKNIFNEEYVSGILISGVGASVTYAKPVTYGVKLEYLF